MASNRVERSDAITVLLHWGFALTLLVSLLTGLRITADNPDASWARTLDGLLLQGAVVNWHIWSALAATFVAVTYVFFLRSARLGSRVAFDAVRRAGLRSSDRRSRWSAINVLLYWVAFTLVAISAISGALLYWAPGRLPHGTVSQVHEVVAWLFMAYVVLHIATQLAQGGLRQLLKILSPRAAYGSAAGLSIVAGVAAAAGFYALDEVSRDELHVERTAVAPIVDGDASDDVWADAKAVTIATTRGHNLPGGEVDVTVRAVHDGEYLYALFEWPDATRSQKHLMLQKTEKGWRVVQSEYGIQDEDEYYEDKFGVMLARSSGLAGAGSAHYGSRPLDGKPGPLGGRGLHYTTDGTIVDVWHWKSVRTGNTEMHQMDDNYFGPPLEPNPNKKRYTGGYTQDPKTGGGFKMNWEEFSDDIVRPIRLPRDPEIMARFQHVDLTADVGDEGSLWLRLDETVPYSEQLDTWPVGTVMPSVMVEGPFQGDRGDVHAVARWEDGRWRMEVRRKLETGSDYDVPLRAGEPAYLWVAVFDHTQTRHSQHLRPVTVILEE